MPGVWGRALDLGSKDLGSNLRSVALGNMCNISELLYPHKGRHPDPMEPKRGLNDVNPNPMIQTNLMVRLQGVGT